MFLKCQKALVHSTCVRQTDLELVWVVVLIIPESKGLFVQLQVYPSSQDFIFSCNFSRETALRNGGKSVLFEQKVFSFITLILTIKVL